MPSFCCPSALSFVLCFCGYLLCVEVRVLVAMPKRFMPPPAPSPTRCLRFTILCWVRKHINIMMKNEELTQPMANPTQEKFQKVNSGLFWPLFCVFFPQQIIFRRLGLIILRSMQETDSKKPKPTKTPLQTPYCCVCTGWSGSDLDSCSSSYPAALRCRAGSECIVREGNTC